MKREIMRRAHGSCIAQCSAVCSTTAIAAPATNQRQWPAADRGRAGGGPAGTPMPAAVLRLPPCDGAASRLVELLGAAPLALPWLPLRCKSQITSFDLCPQQCFDHASSHVARHIKRNTAPVCGCCWRCGLGRRAVWPKCRLRLLPCAAQRRVTDGGIRRLRDTLRSSSEIDAVSFLLQPRHHVRAEAPAQLGVAAGKTRMIRSGMRSLISHLQHK